MARCAAASGSGTPLQARRGVDELAAGEERVHRLALGDEADRAGRSPDGATSASRRAGPRRRAGARKPAIMCSSVVLPAPFGPEQPGDPRPDVERHSLTATTLPYQRETRRQAEDRRHAGDPPVAEPQGRQARRRCSTSVATTVERQRHVRVRTGDSGDRAAEQPLARAVEDRQRVDERRDVGQGRRRSPRRSPLTTPPMRKTAQDAPRPRRRAARRGS